MCIAFESSVINLTETQKYCFTIKQLLTILKARFFIEHTFLLFLAGLEPLAIVRLSIKVNYILRKCYLQVNSKGHLEPVS